MNRKAYSLQLTAYSIFITLLTVHCTLCTVYAQLISSKDLINNAKQFDGQSIIYEGEVIGDVMVRGVYAWVNVSDGDNAIGIWMPRNMADTIEYTGNYKNRGDKVKISGVFKRSCPEHGGDLDIHARYMTVISGRQITDKLNPDKLQRAYILGGILVLVWILTLLKRK